MPQKKKKIYHESTNNKHYIRVFLMMNPEIHIKIATIFHNVKGKPV